MFVLTTIWFCFLYHKKSVVVSDPISESQAVFTLYLMARAPLDCKTVGFFFKISKEIGKAWRKSLMRAKRASLTPDLLFDCSRVLEYGKIRTVLQSCAPCTDTKTRTR